MYTYLRILYGGITSRYHFVYIIKLFMFMSNLIVILIQIRYKSLYILTKVGSFQFIITYFQFKQFTFSETFCSTWLAIIYKSGAFTFTAKVSLTEKNERHFVSSNEVTNKRIQLHFWNPPSNRCLT